MTRSELYQAIWATPPSRLAKAHGITPYRFKQLCQKLEIPLPTNSYWSSLQHGKKVLPTPLPASSVVRDEEQIELSPDAIRAVLGEKPRHRLEGITLPASIRVPSQLRAAHPLVTASQEALKSRWTDRYGKRKCNGGGVLDISVAAASLPRALRLMNTLIREAERSGITVGTSSAQHHAAYLEFDDVRIRFGLTEKMDRKRRPGARAGAYDEWEYHPTGRLTFWLTDEPYHPFRSVSDGKTKRLEDQLARVLEVGSELAFKTRQYRQKLEILHRERRRQAALETERRERAEEERRRREALENIAEAWTRSRQIRDYAGAVEKRLTEIDLPPEARACGVEWLQWARDHADRIDPLEQQVSALVGAIEPDDRRGYDRIGD